MMAPRDAAAAGGASFRFWDKDRVRVEQDAERAYRVLEGVAFRVLETESGRHDVLLDFLLQTGLWEAATRMRPSGLKKDNGIPYPLLNGLECVRELAGMRNARTVATPANCGPLFQDAYLLERIGFAVEKIERARAADHHIIDPESLLNHLARFTEADLEAGFLQHLGVIRQKRWLRGGVYAVDGHACVRSA